MLNDLELREVFHFCFLERLLKTSDPRLYVLKGGVNLRFFFRSPRYSEDMDIDARGGAVATLKKNGYKILGDPSFKRTLQTYGIDNVEVNDPTKAKHTKTTQRFRVQLHTRSGEALPSKIEFSRRETTDAGAITERIDEEVARRYRKLSFNCQHYSGSTAVQQKLLALAGRAVTQARDVFDLYVLSLGGYCHDDEHKEKLSRQQHSAALNNLHSLSYDDFAGQVVEFLDDDSKKQFANRASWNTMTAQVIDILGPPL